MSDVTRELSGLELRVMACEAMGWWPEPPPAIVKWWHSPRCKTPTPVIPHLGCDFQSHAVTEQLPAVESDPAVSEPLFLEWCETNGWLWNMTQRLIPERRVELDIYKPSPGFTYRPIIHVFGSTPSEARARAIVAATKERQHRAPESSSSTDVGPQGRNAT